MAATKLTTINIVELAKRVPPNQIRQFEEFRQKSLKYHRRVNEYPQQLPRIDWEYYRTNVRKDCVKLVEEFQLKYEELNHSFAQRYEVLDHSKYFTELEQLSADVHDDVKKFIAESSERIRMYEEEIRRIKNLNYENMTIEEFVVLREDLAELIPGQGKPLFWPHCQEDQLGEDPYPVISDGNGKKVEGNLDEPKTVV